MTYFATLFINFYTKDAKNGIRKCRFGDAGRLPAVYAAAYALSAAVVMSVMFVAAWVTARVTAATVVVIISAAEQIAVTAQKYEDHNNYNPYPLIRAVITASSE